MSGSTRREEDVLYLTIGATIPILVYLVDERDETEALGDATDANFEIKESRNAATSILYRSVADGNLSIDASIGGLKATLTQAEADALPEGVYIASGWVNFPVNGRSDVCEFRVVISKTTARTL